MTEGASWIYPRFENPLPSRRRKGSIGATNPWAAESRRTRYPSVTGRSPSRQGVRQMFTAWCTAAQLPRPDAEMPGVALHFVLAERLLERWESGDSAPFDTSDGDDVNAFLHGAVGPDLGYFPGGTRLLSELAHFDRTGVLTRCLVATARSSVERAFAWGWLSHVIADRELHPLIGRAVGALRTGSTEVFVDGTSDLGSHLRVELGLDCWYSRQFPSAGSIRLRPAFDARSISFLIDAYRRAYGVDWPTEAFLSSHRAVVRRSRQLLSTLGFVRGLMDEASGIREPSAVGRALRAAWGRPTLRCVTLAYLNPVTPTRWLLEQVAAAVPRALGAIEDLHASGGVEELADYNLDTGRPVAAEPTHPGTVRARNGLRARSSTAYATDLAAPSGLRSSVRSAEV